MQNCQRGDQSNTSSHSQQLQISGFTLTFDVGIACHIGINAAIVYHHILYWLRINAKKSSVKHHDGKIWMYETQEAMSEFFQYLSVKEVKNAIKALTDNGYLLKSKFPSNPFDQTNWYTVPNQEVINPSKKSYSSPPGDHDSEKLGLSDSTQPGLCTYNTKEKQEKNLERGEDPSPPESAPSFSSSDSVKKEERLKKLKNFGEHENVKMTQEEYDKATQKCDKETLNRNIQALDEWIGRGKAKGEKNHYLTLLAFIRREKESQKSSLKPKVDRRQRDKDGNLTTTQYDNLF